MTIPSNGLTANWSTASNWSLGHAPYPCENAVITWAPANTDGVQSVITVDVPIAVNSLTITATSTHSSSQYTLAIIQTGSNNISIANGLTISGTGGSNADNTFGYSQALFLSSGTVSIGGSTTVGNTGTNQAAIGSYQTTTPSYYFYGNVTIGALGATSSGGTYYFDATGAQTLSCSTPTAVNGYYYFPAFGNMVIGNTNSPTLTVSGSSAYGVYISSGNLTINSGASLIIPSGNGLNQYTASTGTFTMANNATLQIAGTTTPISGTNGVTGSNFPGGFATYSFNAGSTVEYYAAGPQTVYNTPAYGNLTFGDAGTTPATVATAGGNLTIAGNLSVNTNATLDLSTYTSNRSSSGGTLTVAGTLKLKGTTGGQTGSNFPSNYSTVTLTGGTVEYYASVAQTIYNTPTYGNLTIGDATS